MSSARLRPFYLGLIVLKITIIISFLECAFGTIILTEHLAKF